MHEKAKIGVLGGRDRILPYRAAGFTTYEAENTIQAAEQLEKAAAECAIVFLTPEYVEALAEKSEAWADVLTPAIVPLPETGGGRGMALLRRAAERAIGADILFREDR